MTNTSIAQRAKRVPVHPGEILLEEFIKPLGLSANKLAKALGVTAPRVNDIALERRGITADMAYRLARYFNMTPEFWMSLQMSYELDSAAKGPAARACARIRPREVEAA